MYLATAQTVGTAFTIGGWSIQWYGIIIAVALLVGIGITMAMFKRKGMDPDSVLDLALIVVPLAIIGARVHYVLWSWQEFGRPFWHVFAIWEGGMAIFGSILAGMLGLLIYSRWRKVPFYTLCDCLVPAVALGQAIGRWGNFANQEVYGAVVTNPSLQWFPMSVYIEATGQYHYALFFYESMFNLALFALLFFVVTRKAKRPGVAFWVYLLGYGLCRAVIEGFREEIYIQRTAGLPMNQIFAAGLALLAAIVLLSWYYKSKRSQKVMELSDDLVLIPDRAKVKVDADGNVIRPEEPTEPETGESEAAEQDQTTAEEEPEAAEQDQATAEEEPEAAEQDQATAEEEPEAAAQETGEAAAEGEQET